MATPTPESMEGIKILIWILTGIISIVGAIALFLVLRFIKRNDSANDLLSDELKDVKKKMSTYSTNLLNNSKNMQESAVAIKQAQLDFQININSELLKIIQSAADVQATLKLNRKVVVDMNDSITAVSETVKEHHVSLTIGAKAMAQSREELAKLRSVVKYNNGKIKIIGQILEKKKAKK